MPKIDIDSRFYISSGYLKRDAEYTNMTRGPFPITNNVGNNESQCDICRTLLRSRRATALCTEDDTNLESTE